MMKLLPFQGVWLPIQCLGAFALYLSLRPVTVGSGRVEPMD